MMNDLDISDLKSMISAAVYEALGHNDEALDLIDELHDEVDIAIKWSDDKSLEDENEQLKREVASWREIVADLLDLPPVMLEKPSDARRYARERAG